MELNDVDDAPGPGQIERQAPTARPEGGFARRSRAGGSAVNWRSLAAGYPLDRRSRAGGHLSNQHSSHCEAYTDYTMKSFDGSRSFVEKLIGVRSFDNAIEVQTEFARQAYADFVAESQNMCELYGGLARQIFMPWEHFAARVTQAGRQIL
jgi:hypothetical protein